MSTPQYGFVIDHRKCIGCHACTVACKAENEVPLGSFRTWVKYTEKGTFPAVKRHFTVLRCNHCDAAPCVEICPVNALHKRKDAIVDLDRDMCIGCRACMQACPYDALYLNEDRGTAEKCHYCAHRTEVGLEPACVTVCPEQAIIAGDVSDPSSQIAALIRNEETSRRKLEKGTKPRVWYVDVLPEALTPGVAREPDSYLWSDRSPLDPVPPVVPGYEPTPDIVTTLDVPHPPAWGWHVWAYLLTKNIAAGAALVAPFLALMGVSDGRVRDLVPEAIALAFLAITNILLVHDLGRPERFWRILLAPNTKSWLVRGAWILSAFGAVTTAALLARLLGASGLADALRWVNVPFAILTAGYSAWLFAQCRGRDLWLESGFFAALVRRAALCGAGLALVLPHGGVTPVIAFSALALTEVGALLMRPKRALRTRDARVAAAAEHDTFGGGRAWPFLLAAALMAAVALALPIGAALVATACAVLAALTGLAIHERAFIHAGQSVALS